MSAQVLVVTSGKGGVGKTLASAIIGSELAKQGHKVVLIDFAIGLRNLDLIMGCERRVIYDIINVINHEATLAQALIQDKILENLFILAASETRTAESLTKDGVGQIIEQLKPDFDFIICDSPAGIEKCAMLAMYYADQAIIVTTQEIAALRAAQRIIVLLNSHSKLSLHGSQVKQHLLINRFIGEQNKHHAMLSLTDIVDTLGLKLLGVIPESATILTAGKLGDPIQKAYLSCVAALLGQAHATDTQEVNRWNFLKKMQRKQPEYLVDN